MPPQERACYLSAQGPFVWGHEPLDLYSEGDLTEIVLRSADLRVEMIPQAHAIARRPGVRLGGKRLLKRVMDYAQVKADNFISHAVAAEAQPCLTSMRMVLITRPPHPENHRQRIRRRSCRCGQPGSSYRRRSRNHRRCPRAPFDPVVNAADGQGRCITSLGCQYLVFLPEQLSKIEDRRCLARG